MAVLNNTLEIVTKCECGGERMDTSAIIVYVAIPTSTAITS